MTSLSRGRGSYRCRLGPAPLGMLRVDLKKERGWAEALLFAPGVDPREEKREEFAVAVACAAAATDEELDA